MDQLIKSKKIDSITTVKDSNNNTILHTALLNNKPEIAASIINKLGSHITTLCKTINNHGKIPLILASTLSDQNAANKLILLLLSKTLDFPIKKLSEPLNEEELIKQNSESLKNPTLIHNLKLASQAINLTRKEAPESVSHPQFNTYTPEKKFEVYFKLDNLRNKMAGEPLDLNEIEDVHKQADMIKSAGVANCGEHSLLTYMHLLDMTEDKPVRIEIVQIIKGDHVFNIIGRKWGSNINNPTTWGDSAVIADAWSGVAYPASQAYSKLSAFQRISLCDDINMQYSILPFYNTKYHTLEPLMKYSNEPSTLDYKLLINTPLALSQFLFSFQDKPSVQAALKEIGHDQINKALTNSSNFQLFRGALPSKDKWKADVVAEVAPESQLKLKKI